jgi:hypothetical protein
MQHTKFNRTFFIFSLIVAFAGYVQAQADFNFEYFPAPKYTKIDSRVYRDTVAKETKIKTDTTTATVNIIVRKTDRTLTVTKLANVSDVLYQSEISFVGFDKSGNLAYKSPNGESIFVNPMRGTIEIVFQDCFDEPQPGDPGLVKKRCNTTRHLLGNFIQAVTPPKK